MTLQYLQNQALKLPTKEKWQLVQTLLSAIQKDSTSPQTTPEKTYPFIDRQSVILEEAQKI